MCLAQGQNAVMPVKLNPTTPRSQDKHSITESLHSNRSSCQMKCTDGSIGRQALVNRSLVIAFW